MEEAFYLITISSYNKEVIDIDNNEHIEHIVDYTIFYDNKILIATAYIVESEYISNFIHDLKKYKNIFIDALTKISYDKQKSMIDVYLSPRKITAEERGRVIPIDTWREQFNNVNLKLISFNVLDTILHRRLKETYG